MSLSLTTLKPSSASKATLNKENDKPVNTLASHQVERRGRPAGTIKAADKVLVGFRVTKSELKELKQLALDLDTSVNDLLLRSIDHYKQTLKVR